MLEKTLEQDLSEASGWKEIANVICTHNRINLNSRYGFKQVHRNFSATLSRLERCWEMYEGNASVMGGIVTIYGKMADDKLLRHQLYTSGGFLTKVLIATKDPSTRSAARHASHTKLKEAIAIKFAPILAHFLESSLSDDEVAGHCISVFSHTFPIVLLGIEDSPDLDSPTIIRMSQDLQAARVVRLTLQRLRMKGLEIKWVELTHAINLITSISSRARDAFEHNPKAVTLMVACLRSRSLGIRCRGLVGLYRLEYKDVACEEQNITPQVLEKANAQELPQDISDAMTSYGIEKCIMNTAIRIESAMQVSVSQFTSDGDLVKFGKALAQHILDAEVTVPSPCGHEVHEDVDFVKAGLTASEWGDRLQECARALRSADELDMADILELKYLITKRRWDVLDRVARKAIDRNPTNAYFYYALTSKSGEEVFGWAKEGLKSGRRAMDLAFGTLCQNSMHGPMWDKGVAWLKSSYYDLKAFVAEAPPDHPRMLPALNRFIIVSIITKGPEMDPDLREISDILQKQKLAEDVDHYFWESKASPHTQVSRVRTILCKMLPKAASQWNIFVERTARKDLDDPESEFNDDPLADTSVTIDLYSEVIRHRYKAVDDPVTITGINDKKIKFYCCSYCEYSTAALRKCGRCGVARYCDAECQRKAWKDHKLVCKSPEIKCI
ncbi:hypothetical protein SISNIDRAFT_455579 [Sistotremastrum niveocremeum HHB9708]|uniref:MYND-type domain-containing protein n=1 Tax=Sistotremastrum niveocremeum HHB9708 TaxID=1314777 RepID=A0A164TIW8_9AGAM|nr:hypothetical protein SISNIDRAFT_455579 [Sistotremastrum niveocremeum HHB9708]